MVDFVRYEWGKKIRDIIPYPKKFNLKHYMSESIDIKEGISRRKIEDLPNYIYELYAVIIHEGRSTHSGHYYCYTRGFESEDCWYCCNDSSVRRLSGIQDALKKEAYILFYQLRKAKPQPEPQEITVPVAIEKIAEKLLDNLE